MSICLYALTVPQGRPGRAQAVRGYTYTMTGRKPAEGRRGAQSVHACTTAAGQHPKGGGRSAHVPPLESMVKPRSLGGRSAAGQAAGGQGLPPFCPFCDF